MVGATHLLADNAEQVRPNEVFPDLSSLRAARRFSRLDKNDNPSTAAMTLLDTYLLLDQHRAAWGYLASPRSLLARPVTGPGH